jgi:hypothetical protein
LQRRQGGAFGTAFCLRRFFVIFFRHTCNCPTQTSVAFLGVSQRRKGMGAPTRKMISMLPAEDPRQKMNALMFFVFPLITPNVISLASAQKTVAGSKNSLVLQSIAPVASPAFYLSSLRCYFMQRLTCATLHLFSGITMSRLRVGHYVETPPCPRKTIP